MNRSTLPWPSGRAMSPPGPVPAVPLVAEAPLAGAGEVALAPRRARWSPGLCRAARDTAPPGDRDLAARARAAGHRGAARGGSRPAVPAIAVTPLGHRAARPGGPRSRSRRSECSTATVATAQLECTPPVVGMQRRRWSPDRLALFGMQRRRDRARAARQTIALAPLVAAARRGAGAAAVALAQLACSAAMVALAQFGMQRRRGRTLAAGRRGTARMGRRGRAAGHRDTARPSCGCASGARIGSTCCRRARC